MSDRPTTDTEIEITPEMIAAGRDALSDIPGYDCLLELGYTTPSEAAEIILRAGLEVYFSRNRANESKVVPLSERDL